MKYDVIAIEIESTQEAFEKAIEGVVSWTTVATTIEHEQAETLVDALSSYNIADFAQLHEALADIAQ